MPDYTGVSEIHCTGGVPDYTRVSAIQVGVPDYTGVSEIQVECLIMREFL